MLPRLTGVLAGLMAFAAAMLLGGIVVAAVTQGHRLLGWTIQIVVLLVSTTVAVHTYRVTVEDARKRADRSKELRAIYSKWGRDFRKGRSGLTDQLKRPTPRY